MTPVKFAALVTRWEEHLWREDFRHAQGDALLVNVNRDPKKGKAASARDFMLSEQQKKGGPTSRPREQTWQDQLAVVVALNSAFGGADLRSTKGA